MANVIAENNSRINFLINECFAKNNELARLNPIIAGGFVVSMWASSKYFNSNLRWNYLKKSLRLGRNLSTSLPPFGDIDIWFSKDNNVRSSDHPMNFLVSNYDRSIQDDLNCQSYGQQNSSYSKVSNCSKGGCPTKSKPLILEDSKSCLFIEKTSKWANTFRQTPGVPQSQRFVAPSIAERLLSKSNDGHNPYYIKPNTIQIINKEVTSVEDVVSDFDLTNCMVAWQDGITFYDERVPSLFESDTLSINCKKQFQQESLAGRVYTALRAFKYYERYLLDFDKELSIIIFEIMFEALTTDISKYSKSEEYVLSKYGRKICTANTLSSMISNLSSKLLYFSEMKNYKKEWSPYFLSSMKSSGSIPF